MPTDFSFVSEEGWQALKPHFDRAEQKLKKKVEKKEISEDQARKLKDLMWKKYDHWAEGEGMKKKEDQTVFDTKPTKKAAAMSREARIGRTQLIDILNAIADDTIQNPAVFQQTLELNKITEQEFFDMLARDAVQYPHLYPKPLVGWYNEHFTDWGYPEEIKKLVDNTRGAVGPQAPASFDRPATPAPAPAAEKPAAAPQPAAPPAAKSQKPAEAPIEPSPWPRDVVVPPPSKKGPTRRFYLKYQTPDGDVKAGVVSNLTFDDLNVFAQSLAAQGYKPMESKALKDSDFPNAGAAPAAPAAAAPVPAALTPAPIPAKPVQPAKPDLTPPTGKIEQPDLKDPNSYQWLVKFQVGKQPPKSHIAEGNGAYAAALMKRYEQMGIKILEMTKMNISPKASIVVSDSDIRLAAEDGPVEKFRNGTPIIFTEDVNLEFDALSARGQIKKNMTGKIKKVEDNDYLIDIAGQLYRVPRLVAEHVMDVFAANVVPAGDQAEQAPQPGQEQGQQPAPKPQEAPAPAAQPAGQNAGQLPPGGAPKMPAGMAAADGRIVIADDDASMEETVQKLLREKYKADEVPDFLANKTPEVNIRRRMLHTDPAPKKKSPFDTGKPKHTLDELLKQHMEQAKTASSGTLVVALEEGHAGEPYDEGDYFAEMGMDADAKTQYMRERNPCDMCPHMSSDHDFSDHGNYACQRCAQENGPCANGYPEMQGPEHAPVTAGIVDDGRIGLYETPEGTTCPQCHSANFKRNSNEHGQPATMHPQLECMDCKHRWSITPTRAAADGRIIVADIEIEAMGMANPDLAKRFVAGATSGKGNHMFIDGDTIYSYGRHFPIATRSGGNVFFLTDQRYSVSTAKHISVVRNAISSAGFSYVLSSRFEDGKVAEPTHEEMAERSRTEAEAKVKRERLEEKRRLRPKKQAPQPSRRQYSEPEIQEQVRQTTAPKSVEELPSLTPAQWASRIQDVEDQLLRETDPQRQEKMRLRLERMKQASWNQAMMRVASGDDAFENAISDIGDLHEEVAKQDKDRNKEKFNRKEVKLENKMPQATAAVQSQAFADLLMLIEQGGPGIPSEIGKRLYRADSMVARV